MLHKGNKKESIGVFHTMNKNSKVKYIFLLPNIMTIQKYLITSRYLYLVDTKKARSINQSHNVNVFICL